SDQTALSSALTDIDAAMQASRSTDQSSGTRPSPEDLKSKIDSLIAGEVSSGKLTSDQATELQGVFKSAFANGPGGAGGPGGPGGAGGPPPGPPPSDGASGSSTTSTSFSGSSSSSDSTYSADDLLKEFLQLLQNSLSSSTSYSATGTSDSSSSLSA